MINIGRGAVVDEAALTERVACGHLRVALDVFQKEPLPLDSPLGRSSLALLSPHIAGPTSDQYPLCGEFALRNVERYVKGEDLDAMIALEVYDRST